MSDQLPSYAVLIRSTREHELCESQRAFAKRIQELAKERDDLDLSVYGSTVAKWESGEYVPAYRFRRYIAEILGTEPFKLFGNTRGRVA